MRQKAPARPLEELCYTTGTCKYVAYFIFLIKFTTGWWTSLITIPAASYSVKNRLSSLLDINTSILQGSAIGPAAYVDTVNAGNLVAAVPGNSMFKYADNTYIIIPASNEMTRHAELTKVQTWAARNNLRLNCSKTTEVISRDHRRRRHHAAAAAEPAPLRSSCLKMLDVSIENNFSIAQHVQCLVTASAQNGLRVACATDSRTGRRRSAAHLPCHRRCSFDVRHQTARASTACWIARGVTGTARQTCRRSTSSVTLLMMNCLAKLCDCLTMSSTH